MARSQSGTQLRLSQERAPIAFLLRAVATAAMAKGVTGFRLGASSSYTRYAGVRKA
jgi:hypothetical protein